MEPPPCVQNAMMKQDKKPFTYTPGGIDLSEIKSPRMARRIERNANYSGAPEAPRPQQPPQSVGPLPPSALAAMQPQMHVQVFPSGPPPPPPGPRGGAPPPPPPPSNMPPPPPPPMQPLPTQKVTTAENQVLERPDMTKIIPDNPMALLRKTGGPQPRKSLVDEVYAPQPAPPPPPQRSPPVQQNQQRWAPPQQPSPPVQQPSPPSRWGQQSPPAQQWSPPTQQPQSPRYPPPVIERTQEDQPIKTSTAHIGSLYIPPINQQQQQRSVASPPPAPKRDPQSPLIQSPGTPTLKEAPKPWQKQPKQTEEVPVWAKKEPVPVQEPVQQQVFSPVQQPAQQPRFNQNHQPVQQPPQQRFVPNQQQPRPTPASPNPNAVYITQPVVLQHPGPVPNRPRVDAQGAIVIPVQIEGARKVPATPVTPGNDRSLNRQQSWSNNPTQSNSFKIIQKITQTDGDDEDENEPVVEHAPRYPQQFQQTPPAEQMRKLKLTEGDRDLMNRFKQGVDDDASLHNEVDPRYRGPAIPSKAFKLLQSMTDGSESPTGATVPRGNPGGNRSPQVRTIPIQIERDDAPKNYVHPSEQTVPEPKKYTGSSIPSRSFKILQAMTAPDSCANANEVNENYDPSSYNPWGYDPNYPPPVPPYYYYYYPPVAKEPESDPRQTPVPFWGYYPPPYPYMPPPPLKTPDSGESDSETARSTPLPFWGYYPQYYPTEEYPAQDDKSQYQYPPYWDPYYYYYGYPPMYSPYPFYGPSSDSEEVAGYSSTDEMQYFTQKKEIPVVEEERAVTPKVAATPVKNVVEYEEVKSDHGDSSVTDSDSETEVEEEEPEPRLFKMQSSHSLQAIRSVKDINIYNNENCSDDEVQIEECSEDIEDNDDCCSIYVIEDETIPHQLSVIFEESERTDSKRESSILSDSTTIAEKSDDEEDVSTTVSLKLPLKLNLTQKVEEVEKKEEIEEIVADNKNETANIYASFTLQSPSVTPRESLSPCREKEAISDEECAEEHQKEIEETTPAEIPNCDKEEAKNVEEEEEEDWWSILNKDEDVVTTNRVKIESEEHMVKEEELLTRSEDTPTLTTQNVENVVDDDDDDDDDEDASSTSSSDSSSSESNASKKDADSSSEEEDSDANNNNTNVENPEPMSIKDRIQALKDSIQRKKNQVKEETEVKISVKDKVSAIEVSRQIKTASTKSSVKSLEEFSEEEGDSGVTSDMSRHISDNEEFPELKKMTRYQRAATHSRLFKLLQEECDEDEEEEEVEEVVATKEDKFSKLSVRQQTVVAEESAKRRDQLSLPLKNVSDESFSSSGITSPGSPVNEKLVTELVQSMLKRKKGQVFRNLPKEKLQAAAKRILQEEFEDLSTPDSSFLSPLRNSTESSTPAQTPQEFYNDYKQYYDSWSDAERLYDENYDILPSKAFKLLQEHSGLNRTGAIAGLLAKCPKILSSKNVHQELMRLIERPDSPETSPEPCEVASAS